MKRSILLVATLSLVPVSNAGEKFASLEVTGVIQLPAGASYPAKVQVDIEIAKIEPGKVITFHKIVGRTELRVLKSTPVEFAVRCPKSHLKDTPPSKFTLRAKVYDTSSGRKLLYETPLTEALQPFTDGGEPKQNVTLPVKAPVGK
jgi:hypothetical protein